MATLSCIPSFHSLFPYKFSLFSPPLKLCPPRICASAIKKPRESRKVKSNAELCNDIRDFLAKVGLPEDHVPSMKELSQHGRQDLANIVRRRGYKAIKELLAVSAATSLTTYISGIQEAVHDSEEKLTGQNEKVTAPGGDVSLASDASKEDYKSIDMDRKQDSSCLTDMAPEVSFDLSLQHKVGNFTQNGSQVSIQKEKTIDLADDVYLLCYASIMDQTKSIIRGRKPNYDDQSCSNPGASFYLALHEKAANFVYNGQLDTIEDGRFGILSKINTEDASSNELPNALELEYSLTRRYVKDGIASGADGTESSTGKEKSPFQHLEYPMVENTHSRNDSLSVGSVSSGDHSVDLEVETHTVEHQAEINRLKFMLHQKEMELFQLKQEIEKEKLALSSLQTKVEMEINKAHKLISEKDAELQAAEESLSGLKEVEIQYLGDGEHVEVCGSFNGWHDRIKMDRKQSSSGLDSTGPRKSQLWTTAIWLYPGVYEIKFIVDGHWKIDPQRESTVRGSIHNNVLRVDR